MNNKCKNCDTESKYICFECEDIFIKEKYPNYFYNDDFTYCDNCEDYFLNDERCECEEG